MAAMAEKVPGSKRPRGVDGYMCRATRMLRRRYTRAVADLRLAVLISGSGSTLRNILERIRDGRLPGVEAVGVVASRRCAGLEVAEQYGVPAVVVDRCTGGNTFD